MYNVTGLGACQEVGRSGFLLDFGEKFLLDYGIKLTPDGVDYPLDVKEHVKAVVISHAHLDHSGLLPYYYKNSECISFMTQSTLELADILWKDSIKIAEFEGMAPKYTKQEIERTHRYNFIVPYNRSLHLSHDVSFEFFDAGHILGSALTKINCGDKSFLYTGDYKLEETQLHKGANMSMGHIDYVMIESTYGDRDHPKRKASEIAFCESVQETVDRGGWAIVPVLAIGRAQEIIDILSKYSITAPIFLDGMGKAVSEVYLRHSELIKDPKGLKRGLSSVIWVQGKNGRAKVMKNPCVIVTTSGMMKGGPVVGYVEKLMNDRNSKIHLTSYQAEGTPGRLLMEKGVLPFGKSGQNVKIACKYEKYDFSAHPDQGEMIRSLKAWSPQEVFLVHGDKDVMGIFAKKIYSETGIKANILTTGKRIDFG